MVLWYRQPARNGWRHAAGERHHGGHGLRRRPAGERIALNERALLVGRPHDYDNPQALQYFPRYATWSWPGSSRKRRRWRMSTSTGSRRRSRPISRSGICCSHSAVSGTDYRRELDMETGVARISYRAGDAVITCEVFVSYPDRVLVVRIAGDRPGRVSVQARFQSPYRDRAAAKPGMLVMDGCWKGPIPIRNWLIAPVEGKGLRFQARRRASPRGPNPKQRRPRAHRGPTPSRCLSRRPPATSITTTSRPTRPHGARRSLTDCRQRLRHPPPPA